MPCSASAIHVRLLLNSLMPTHSPKETLAIIGSLYGHVQSPLVTQRNGHISWSGLRAVYKEVSGLEGLDWAIDSGAVYLDVLWPAGLLNIYLCRHRVSGEKQGGCLNKGRWLFNTF